MQSRKKLSAQPSTKQLLHVQEEEDVAALVEAVKLNASSIDLLRYRIYTARNYETNLAFDSFDVEKCEQGTAARFRRTCGIKSTANNQSQREREWYKKEKKAFTDVFKFVDPRNLVDRHRSPIGRMSKMVLLMCATAQEELQDLNKKVSKKHRMSAELRWDYANVISGWHLIEIEYEMWINEHVTQTEWEERLDKMGGSGLGPRTNPWEDLWYREWRRYKKGKKGKQ